jgi:hypothetical protein
VLYHGNLKNCEGDGCGNKVPFGQKLCTECVKAAKKRAESPFPDDPECEQKTELYEQFRLLRFTESEARRLADAWADPARISWWLEQGCGHKRACEIAI